MSELADVPEKLGPNSVEVIYETAIAFKGRETLEGLILFALKF